MEFEDGSEPTEMEIIETAEALNQFYGTAEEVLTRYAHCMLCGANLHFTHSTDFNRNVTAESAKCPECGIKVRQMMHRLQ